MRNEDMRIPGITKMYEVTLTNRVSCLPRLLGATSSMTRCRPARWWHMPFSAGMKTGNNGREAVGRRRVLARDAEYAPDENGNYTALLRMYSANGVPAGLFTSGEARWLAVQVGQQPEQPRVLLVSVPYALKGGDAQTLDGSRLWLHEPIVSCLFRGQEDSRVNC